MPSEIATSAPVLVIQIIHCGWDKSARGGKLAEARNRIPLSLPLRFPDREFQGQVLAHITHWGVRNKFITATTEKCEFPAGDKFVYRGARVALQGDSAMMDFIQEEWQGSPPFPDSHWAHA